MKAIKIIMNVILLVLVILWGYTFYRQHTHGTWAAYWNSSANDCTMKMPENLRVVYNQENKRYAIEITNIWGKQFLWARTGDWVDESFAVNTDFSDSCIAKGFASQYLKERQEYNSKLQGYK
ncbi:MAG: hypothetical protein V4560_14935 [Bacteroidota bacterium]